MGFEKSCEWVITTCRGRRSRLSISLMTYRTSRPGTGISATDGEEGEMAGATVSVKGVSDRKSARHVPLSEIVFLFISDYQPNLVISSSIAFHATSGHQWCPSGISTSLQ